MSKKMNTLTALLLAGSFLPHAHATTTTHKSSKPAPRHATPVSATTHGHSSKKGRSRKLRGQQAIEPERVTQIQQALIKAHYFTGEADGNWNEHTIAAMQKFQADNNWQTKLMPDARALAKLGLGPDYSNAINAKGASFSAPSTDSSTTQSSGFVSASGISR
jgi:peptidoglycan hydrolase-like protein with peptidoglycan-binding domain